MTTIRSDRRIPLNVLMVSCGVPLVRFGGSSPALLREEVFDDAIRVNFRAGFNYDIDAAYATAMMGGEPYADWS